MTLSETNPLLTESILGGYNPKGKNYLASQGEDMASAQKTPAATDSTASPHSMLIEGWRGVSHSFSLVNQWQILEFLKMDSVKLFHRDMPFAIESWHRDKISAGFSAEDQAAIDALTDSPDEPIDSIYRMAAPFSTNNTRNARRVLTFMVTELGLTEESFEKAGSPELFVCGDNLIVTPSNWARERIVEYGFAADKVYVVPHGVSQTTFSSITDEERQRGRAALGINEDEFVFLNLGAATWNKGVDVLVRAFARLRRSGRNVRLILKEQTNLYGLTSGRIVQQVAQESPDLINDDVIQSISLASGNFSNAQLRNLYGIADCYVSPYRAEGFNLPVLEAIACGVPVIVTAGGATDDFCTDKVSVRVPGEAGSLPRQGTPLRFIEPSLAALTDAMDAFSMGNALDLSVFAKGREEVIQKHSWARAANELLELAKGFAPNAPITDAVKSVVKDIQSGQRRVLNFLDMLRPMAMSKVRKIHLGKEYDGGYVLPDVALNCDAVVSIGVGPDVSFDLELAQHGAKVLQFDHTVDQVPQAHTNFIYHKKGWGVRTEGDLLHFDEIDRLLSELKPKRPLLKFDVEGYEYEALQTTSLEHLAQFEVIVCELHDFGKMSDAASFQKMWQALEKLTTHHVPVHMHVNNYGGIVLVEGVPVPEVVEVSFLRRDLDEFPDFSSEGIPGPLDRPNNPLKPDVCLSPFAKAGDRSIYIYCDGGLANRFNALVSGLAVADMAGLQPVVVWPTNNWCGARYCDLFDRPLRVIEKELAAFAPSRHNFQFLMIEDRLNLAYSNASPLNMSETAQLDQYLSQDTRDVFYYMPLIPPFISHAVLRKQVAATPFRRELRERAQRFIDEHGLKEYFGVQIRKTDFGVRGADSDTIYDHVRQSRDKQFFVCSDDQQVEKDFGKLPNVVTFEKSAYVEKLVEGGWNEEITDSSGRRYPCNVNRSALSVQDAVIDLLILSQSNIIPTSGSTFLGLAHLIRTLGISITGPN